MDTHPLVGESILRPIGQLSNVATIIRATMSDGMEQGIPMVWRERKFRSGRVSWRWPIPLTP